MGFGGILDLSCLMEKKWQHVLKSFDEVPKRISEIKYSYRYFCIGGKPKRNIFYTKHFYTN